MAEIHSMPLVAEAAESPSNLPPTFCNAISWRLLDDYDELGSWSAVGRLHDVSSSMAWRIANEGYEPKDKEIRDKLGYPEIIEIKVRRNKKTGRYGKVKNGRETTERTD